MCKYTLVVYSQPFECISWTDVCQTSILDYKTNKMIWSFVSPVSEYVFFCLCCSIVATQNRYSVLILRNTMVREPFVISSLQKSFSFGIGIETKTLNLACVFTIEFIHQSVSLALFSQSNGTDTCFGTANGIYLERKWYITSGDEIPISNYGYRIE